MPRLRFISAVARQLFVFAGLALGTLGANAATGDAPDDTEPS